MKVLNDSITMLYQIIIIIIILTSWQVHCIFIYHLGNLHLDDYFQNPPFNTLSNTLISLK